MSTRMTSGRSAGLPEGLGGVRGHAGDRHALSLEENARHLEEGIVVVNE